MGKVVGFSEIIYEGTRSNYGYPTSFPTNPVRLIEVEPFMQHHKLVHSYYSVSDEDYPDLIVLNSLLGFLSPG